MSFCSRPTRPICRFTPEEVAAESDLLNDQRDVRDRSRQPKTVGSAPCHEVLAGWKVYDSKLKETDAPVEAGRIATASQLELVRQIIQLREMLRETREEVEILVEALAYARRICPER